MTQVPDLALNNGQTIPQLGFGVFQIDPAETAEAVSRALDVGYRHIDTAEMYRNEKGVGEAVRASGLDRGEVFVTSKLNNAAHEPDDARRAFDGTLEALGFDYVDLFLIHWPLPTLYGGDFVSTWQTMEEFYRDGRARSIGVSNFQVAAPAPAGPGDRGGPGGQPDRGASRTSPTRRCARTGRSTASSPRPGRRSPRVAVLEDPTITDHRRAGGQDAPPRSPCAGTSSAATSSSRSRPRPSRIKENFELFDFELTDDDLTAISALDKGEEGRTAAPTPTTFAHVPELSGQRLGSLWPAETLTGRVMPPSSRATTSRPATTVRARSTPTSFPRNPIRAGRPGTRCRRSTPPR